jgi:hypothetical protein
MKLFTGKFLLIFIFVLFSFFCFAQNGRKLSLGLGTDYGFGKDFNNYASTVKLNYYLFEKFRISPSFSYFFNKNNMEMSVFSFNFHYLFPDLVPRIFPIMKNQSVCFYPVAGFCIASIDRPKKLCSDCSTSTVASRANYVYNFGFDFGMGLDYDLPTLLPILRDMTVSFEFQYQIVDIYSRPQLLFGIMYNF